MNARMIVLACLLATVGVPARSAAVVLAPTTVNVYTLEFEPTQNARPGSSGVMTIKILDGGTTVFFALRGGYPNTVYTIWTVFNQLVVPLPTDPSGTAVPACPATGGHSDQRGDDVAPKVHRRLQPRGAAVEVRQLRNRGGEAGHRCALLAVHRFRHRVAAGLPIRVRPLPAGAPSRRPHPRALRRQPEGPLHRHGRPSLSARPAHRQCLSVGLPAAASDPTASDPAANDPAASNPIGRGRAPQALAPSGTDGAVGAPFT